MVRIWMLSRIKLLTFLVALLSLVSLLSGCFLIKIYGVSYPRPVTDEDIRNTATRFGIAPHELGLIDTSKYLSVVWKYADSMLAQDLLQPLQIRYYDNDTLSLFVANCHTGGFPNLSWNSFGVFNTFPPSPWKPRTFRYSSEDEVTGWSLSDLEMAGHNVLIIYWTVFMGRQSKRLINFVKHYQINNDTTVQVRFINIDALYAE